MLDDLQREAWETAVAQAEDAIDAGPNSPAVDVKIGVPADVVVAVDGELPDRGHSIIGPMLFSAFVWGLIVGGGIIALLVRYRVFHWL